LDPQEMKCLAQDLGIPACELRALAAKTKMRQTCSFAAWKRLGFTLHASIPR
jgi:hypothetical protein